MQVCLSHLLVARGDGQHVARDAPVDIYDIFTCAWSRCKGNGSVSQSTTPPPRDNVNAHEMRMLSSIHAP